MSSPLDRVTFASFNYYSCLEASSDKHKCKREYDILLAKIAVAEMLDVKEDNIKDAVNIGKYNAKSECMINKPALRGNDNGRK